MTQMTGKIGAALAPALAGLLLSAVMAQANGTNVGDVVAGQALAKRLCSRCHAIAGTGPSPLAQAPLFSGFERKWPVDYLAEAMAEGLVIGHGPMPEFTFTPEEIDDLLAYLHSVQLADSGAAADGLALATEDCAACHRVKESQPQPSAVAINETTSQETVAAPSFHEIALRDGRDADYLRAFIREPHYPMPEQQFIPGELEAIVGYIVSLKDSGGSW